MLFTIKKILVCTDLSSHSNLVVKNAEILRQRTGAELDLFYVSDIGLHLDFAIRTKRTFYDAFLSDLSLDLQKKLTEQVTATAVQASVVFEEGDVAEKISEQLGKTKYDLLIIGHSSRRNLVTRILGSVARKILSGVEVPTLVIDEDLKFQKVGSLVDTSGPLEWMVTSSLDFYRSLKFQKIEFISLVHQNEREKKDKLEEEISYFLHQDENASVRVEMTQDYQVAQHLFNTLKQDNVDLAIMKRNRGLGLRKMLLGSETLRMLELAPVNLLVLPV